MKHESVIIKQHSSNAITAKEGPLNEKEAQSPPIKYTVRSLQSAT